MACVIRKQNNTFLFSVAVVNFHLDSDNKFPHILLQATITMTKEIIYLSAEREYSLCYYVTLSIITKAYAGFGNTFVSAEILYN